MRKVEKEILRPLYEKVWGRDVRMVEYCLKKVDEYAEVNDGYYVIFDKPNIETSFCFGYSLSRYDTESFDAAGKMAQHASESEEYFFRKNLEQLEVFDENEEYVAVTTYDRDCKVVALYLKKVYENRPWITNGKFLFELSREDVKKVVEASKRQTESFKKRLNTYLKKYGTSKLRTWTYWQDE